MDPAGDSGKKGSNEYAKEKRPVIEALYGLIYGRVGMEICGQYDRA